MPVLSYLAYPAQGEKETLASALRELPECEVIESDNDDLLILITQTENQSEELELEKRLDQVTSLSMLALVFGHRADSLTSKESHA